MITPKIPALCVGMLATLCVCEAKPKQPNVILVMCDDLGWGDVGFNGNQIIRTPNIDAMAGQGVVFNRFYTACAVSSPTRASVLTGRNPYRTGVFNANVGILRPEEITISELLKEEGYATGHFGKWHLGSLTASEHDANRGRVGNERELNLPKDHGYDQAFVTESKVPTWDPMITPTDKKMISSGGWSAIKPGQGSKPYGTHYWDIDGTKVTTNLEGDDSRVVLDRAIPFMKSSVDSQTPFLSVIWFHAPHKPCVAGPEYAKMYSQYKKDFMNYAGCITAMDDQMGRLLEFLESNDIADDTIVFFCSDNGPENGEGVTGGFRARKRSLYEGGVRVPSFVYWGKNIKKPFRTDYPAVTCDYLPTIVSAVGIDPAKCTNELDGIDLMRVIKGKERGERNTPIVLAYNGQLAYCGDTFKLYTKGDKKEFYNIVDDPYEQTPLTTCADGDVIEGKMVDTYEHYRKSFMGEEYGVESFNRMKQSWPAR